MIKKNLHLKLPIFCTIFVFLTFSQLIFSNVLSAKGNWLKAYEQGEKFLKGGKWEKAIGRFDDALAVRDKDDKSVRLYGMKFGYFPHRGKGIALYRLGRLEESIKELKLSIQQSQSDMAVKHLDLALKAPGASKQESRRASTGGAKWNESYLRGLELIESKEWRSAIQAFDEGIQQKGEDNKSLKIYGMRYGYFPHREKGVAHTQLGEWELAVKELETSLAQSKSERASEYLASAKKKKKLVDVSIVIRDNWWGYYDRGNILAGEGAWEQAIEDFQKAIKKRDKTAKDKGKWLFRTSGMVFIDYFPHRELGVAYYKTGQFKKAVRELEKSVTITQTAKAAFFLKEAKKELLHSKGGDKNPPRLTIKTPTKNQLTNLFSIDVTGIAEDPNSVSAVWVNGRLLFMELAENRVSFSRKVSLTSGENKIKVTAADLAGNKTSKDVTVRVDREGPLIIFDNFADGDVVKSSQITLKGLLLDDTKVVELAINDKAIGIKKSVELEFSKQLTLREGNNGIKVRAKDSIGNVTEDTINLTYDSTAPGTGAREAGFRPSFPFIGGAGFQNIGLSLTSIFPSWIFNAFSFNSPAIQTIAARPPIIKLKDLEDGQKVSIKKILLEGKAIALGKTQVNEVLINGEPLMIRPGKSLIFSHLVELEKGENLFEIMVIDTNGLDAIKEFKIIREVPEMLKIGSRMTVAVLPFKSGKAKPEMEELVNDTLTNAFVNQERFKIVARKGDLDAVLEELKLSSTGLVDKSTALRLGKVLAAEGMISGSLTIKKDHIEVVARLINSETSEILASKDVYDQFLPDAILEKVNFLMEGLAFKFTREFPLVQGEVIKMDGPAIMIDLGTAHGLRKDMKFIIFRQGEVIKHPVTGKILGSESQILSEARIEQVFENFSKGIVTVEVTKNASIKPLDKVITK